jgi:hypothetical protein
MRTTLWRRLLAPFACAAAFAAHAQTAGVAPSYAILALIGDRVSVVTHQMGTGSRLDTNRHQDAAMPDDTLDGFAVFAADDAIKQLQPAATTSLFATRDAKLFAMQEAEINASAASRELAEAVKPLVEKSAARHLVLITKHRAPTRIRFVEGHVGSGWLSGIGFYVDPWAQVAHLDTRQSAEGYFSPYAYLKVTVFDMTTLRPLSQANAAATDIVTTTHSKSAAVAWQAMTAAEKVDALKAVIRTAVGTAMPKVLGPR